MNFSERISSFFEELQEKNRTPVFIICCILIFFAFTALIIAAVQYSAKKAPAEVTAVPQETFTPTQPVLPPESENSLYTMTTIPQEEKWDADKAAQWYEEPSAPQQEALSHANDLLIQNITGAAL